MSFQIAAMAAMVAVSAAASASAASKGAAAASTGAASEEQASMIRASGLRAAAAGTGVEIAETRLSTAQQEIGRRMAIEQLRQQNAIDAVGRGAAPGGGTDSAAVAQSYNRALGEADIANIRFMGESRVSKLSFRQQQQNLGVAAEDLQQSNIATNLGLQTDMLYTQMGFQMLGAAAKGAARMSYGGGGGEMPTGSAAASASLATQRLPMRGAGQTTGFGSSW